MHCLRMGVDPYAASLARQKAEATLGHDKGEAALGHHVFVYLYPPISIEFLKVLDMVPAWLRAAIFWMVYAVGFGLQLWAGSRVALETERRMLRFVFPLVMFFPAFVPSDTLLSGNIAIPMYGAVLAAAARGWHRQRWGVFFGVVLASSLLKPPILVWLVVPLLLGAAQVVPCGRGGALRRGAVRCSEVPMAPAFRRVYVLDPLHPSLGDQLQPHGDVWEVPGIHRAPFRPRSDGVLRCCFSDSVRNAAYFARELRRKNVAGQNFAAVVLVSTALFALRLKEYDLLPLTIPMALIVLRGVRNPGTWIMLILGAVAVGVALVTTQLTAVDTISVVTVFLVGVYGFSTEAQDLAGAPPARRSRHCVETELAPSRRSRSPAGSGCFYSKRQTANSEFWYGQIRPPRCPVPTTTQLTPKSRRRR